MFIAFYVAFTDDPEYSFGAEHVAPGRERESFLVFPKTSFPTTQAQERFLDQIAAHLGISSETHYRALVSRTNICCISVTSETLTVTRHYHSPD